jgi:transcriptional regulator with XRE-family HTH domain
MDAVVERVGTQLRALRNARQRTLEDLAADTGFTVGYLSQIETGATLPSLSALAAIAASLDADVTAFFAREPGPNVRVSRADDPDTLRIAPSASEEYVILGGGTPDATYTALVTTHQRHHDQAPSRLLGERFALVLRGRVRFEFDNEVLELGPDDYIHYSSHSEHRVQTDTDESADVLWLVSPPIL